MPEVLLCLGMHKDVGNELAGKGGWLWALGLFLKARKEDKTRKLTFYFRS